ncbi:MAG: hypothetical protein KI792_01665 [Alphaproteobacteria bacterium]|nr:hypothetical protein [Alphaproteobacteria bacterium SS10]
MSEDDLIHVDVHDFMENNRGELMLVLDGQPEPPTSAAQLRLAHKRDEAVLHRGDGKDMLIDKIHPEAMEKLRDVETIVVTEMDGEEILHSYFAKVQEFAQA